MTATPLETPQQASPASKQAFMEQARAELGDRRGWHSSLDDVVDLAARRMLESAGVHDGCEVELPSGRRFRVTAVNWSEVEVSDGRRWYSLWHGPAFLVPR